MPNAQDDLMDVLSLARSINTDISQLNSMATSDSKQVRTQLIDPKRAAGALAEAASNAAIASPRPIAPTMVQTLDGYSVPAPIGLISLPEGVTMPELSPRPIPASNTPPPYTVPLVNPTPTPAPNGQLELGLELKTRTMYANQLEYFEEKMNRIEAKFDIINSKLNDILFKIKRKYEKRETTQEKLD